MWQLFISLVLLAFALFLGVQIQNDPGYVLIVINHWSIEASFWAGLALLFIIFIIFHFIIRMFSHTRQIPFNMRRWGDGRRLKQARELTSEGLCELAEGYWSESEHKLIKGAKASTSPLVNYLAAARAAQAQQAYDRRNEYLQQALLSTKGSELAVGLTKAQLHIQSSQWDTALQTLVKLHKDFPKHSYITTMLANVYVQLADWDALNDLIPLITKSKVLGSHELLHLQQQLHIALLDKTNQLGDSSELKNTWKSIPRSLRMDVNIVEHYCKILIERGDDDEAISLIESVLKKNWQQSLLAVYADAVSSRPKKQINQAESWLSKHSQDAALLFCIGKIYFQQEQWEQAKKYLQEAAELITDVGIYDLLGQSLEQLGDSEQAMVCYRKGLSVQNAMIAWQDKAEA